jgi:hypothetical protein
MLVVRRDGSTPPLRESCAWEGWAGSGPAVGRRPVAQRLRRGRCLTLRIGAPYSLATARRARCGCSRPSPRAFRRLSFRTPPLGRRRRRPARTERIFGCTTRTTRLFDSTVERRLAGATWSATPPRRTGTSRRTRSQRSPAGMCRRRPTDRCSIWATDGLHDARRHRSDVGLDARAARRARPRRAASLRRRPQSAHAPVAPAPRHADFPRRRRGPGRTVGHRRLRRRPLRSSRRPAHLAAQPAAHARRRTPRRLHRRRGLQRALHSRAGRAELPAARRHPAARGERAGSVRRLRYRRVARDRAHAAARAHPPPLREGGRAAEGRGEQQGTDRRGARPAKHAAAAAHVPGLQPERWRAIGARARRLDRPHPVQRSRRDQPSGGPPIW